MDRETIDMYIKWEELNDSNIEGLSIQELFNLKFELLQLREEILERLDQIDSQKENLTNYPNPLALYLYNNDPHDSPFQKLHCCQQFQLL